MKTQDMKLTHLCFQLIMVSFYSYLFISIHGRTLLIFMLLLTHLFMPINNIITQTIFMVLFTSSSLLTWGKPSDASFGLSPQVFVCHLLSIDYIPLLLQTPFDDRLHFLLIRVRQMGKDLTPLWGHLTICPPLQQFHIPSITQLELSSLTSLKAWGRNRRSITISPTCWYWLRRRPHGIEGMVFQPFR